MRRGLLEKILNRRYGEPDTSKKDGLIERSWTDKKTGILSTLYVGMKWNREETSHFLGLQEIYGGAIGGFLFGDSLKIAMLLPHQIFGLYNINELWNQPEVKQALTLDPDVVFFMDASNVWYYGYKSGNLYVYDAETGELDPLGQVEIALETLLDEWEYAVEGKKQ